MTFVTIDAYEPHPVDEIRLLNRQIDVPVGGSTYRSYVFRIEGWLLFKGSQPSHMQVRLGSLVMCNSKVFVERQDVSDYFNHISGAVALGFSCDVEVLLFPETFKMQIVVVFEDGSEASVGIIRGKRYLPAAAMPTKLQPLRVYGLGRSGTTMLMRYLLYHPQIVAYNKYPYEVRMMTYFQHVMKVLTSHGDHDNSAHPDNFVFDQYHLGYNPYYVPDIYGESVGNWFSTSQIEEVVSFCKRSIDTFYLSLAESRDKTEVRLFAEKDISNILNICQWLWYPKSHGILLVRDFRDRHCSALSFNKKRGHDAFGYEDKITQEDFVHRTKLSFSRYQEWLRIYPNQMIVVRYEDLILKPRETLVNLFSKADLDVSPATIDKVLALASQDNPELKQHRTTDVGQSIGRWKKDLDPKIAQLYSDIMGDTLSELGYEVW